MRISHPFLLTIISDWNKTLNRTEGNDQLSITSLSIIFKVVTHWECAEGKTRGEKKKQRNKINHYTNTYWRDTKLYKATEYNHCE